ncbi:MAG: hypothetical protein QXW70_02395 [Candidatus Anstonellales archaeon]
MAVEYGELYLRLANSGVDFVTNIVEGVVAALLVLIILSIGYIVARALVFVLKKALLQIKFEKFLAMHGIHDALFGFTATSLLSLLLGLAVMVAFLGIAADVAGVPTLVAIADWAGGYIYSFTQGVVVLAVALIAADYVTDNLTRAKHVPFLNLLGVGIKVFIAYNALVMALPLLIPDVSVELLTTSFQLAIGAIALAVGLGGAIAIGLGFKDAVAEIAKKKKSKFEHWL